MAATGDDISDSSAEGAPSPEEVEALSGYLCKATGTKPSTKGHPSYAEHENTARFLLAAGYRRPVEGRVLLDLRAVLEAEVDAFTCKTPAYGAPGHAHCAACCGGTGIAATCQEEEDLARAVGAALNALNAHDAALRPVAAAPADPAEPVCPRGCTWLCNAEVGDGEVCVKPRPARCPTCTATVWHAIATVMWAGVTLFERAFFWANQRGNDAAERARICAGGVQDDG